MSKYLDNGMCPARVSTLCPSHTPQQDFTPADDPPRDKVLRSWTIPFTLCTQRPYPQKGLWKQDGTRLVLVFKLECPADVNCFLSSSRDIQSSGDTATQWIPFSLFFLIIKWLLWLVQRILPSGSYSLKKEIQGYILEIFKRYWNFFHCEICWNKAINLLSIWCISDSHPYCHCLQQFEAPSSSLKISRFF